MLYRHICGNIIEQIHFLKKYKSITLYFRKGDVLLCVRDEWRQGQAAVLTQVLLLIIAALLPHLDLGCSTGGHWGPKALNLQLALTLASCFRLYTTHPGTCLYYFLTSTCFRYSSAYLHGCISWLTARSRVNI